jgi:hypothetical protein
VYTLFNSDELGVMTMPLVQCTDVAIPELGSLEEYIYMAYNHVETVVAKVDLIYPVINHFRWQFPGTREPSCTDENAVTPSMDPDKRQIEKHKVSAI